MLGAGIVDEDVDATKGIGGFLHHRFDLVRLGQVMAAIERFSATRFLQREPFLLDRVRVAKAVDDDIGAFPGQNLGIGQADAGRGTGDERRLASQKPAHAFFSLR